MHNNSSHSNGAVPALTAVTKSGACYVLTGFTEKGNPMWSRDGAAPVAMVGLFPDRLPFFEATTKWQRNGDRLEGYNAQGVRTLSFIPDQVRVGMILASPKGNRSTEIVTVRRG